MQASAHHIHVVPFLIFFCPRFDKKPVAGCGPHGPPLLRLLAKAQWFIPEGASMDRLTALPSSPSSAASRCQAGGHVSRRSQTLLFFRTITSHSQRHQHKWKTVWPSLQLPVCVCARRSHGDKYSSHELHFCFSKISEEKEALKALKHSYVLS